MCRCGLKLLKIAESLNGHRCAGHGVITACGLAQAKAQHFPCATRQLAQQPAIGHKEFAQNLGDAENPLPMRHRFEHFFPEPGAELHHALLVVPQGHFLRAQDRQKCRLLHENGSRYS